MSAAAARHKIEQRRPVYERAADDWYVEPPWAIAALLEVEPLSGVTLDPACGEGRIPTTLGAYGLTAVGSDLRDRGFGWTGIDFLADDLPSVDNVVSNPPFRLFLPFLDRSLVVARRKVILLGRLALLEGQERSKVLEASPLARVWVSRRRISMPPGGTDIEPKGGTMAFAWYVWKHGHTGPPALGWC